jgi:hypothetical protein
MGRLAAPDAAEGSSIREATWVDPRVPSPSTPAIRVARPRSSGERRSDADEILLWLAVKLNTHTYAHAPITSSEASHGVSYSTSGKLVPEGGTGLGQPTGTLSVVRRGSKEKANKGLNRRVNQSAPLYVEGPGRPAYRASRN